MREWLAVTTWELAFLIDSVDKFASRGLGCDENVDREVVVQTFAAVLSTDIDTT